jgi:exosortase D (VPLPA-CTERM-specific)
MGKKHGIDASFPLAIGWRGTSNKKREQMMMKAVHVKTIELKNDIILFFGVVFSLLLVAYWSTIKWLVIMDWTKDDYSHAMLVPPICLFLIWQKRNELRSVKAEPSWLGFMFLFAGLLLYWLGELAGEFFTLYLSLWTVIFGVCLGIMGWKKLKVILFPIVFSIASFPFPNFINARITLRLQLISSQLGGLILRALGISVYREGNVIDLGFTKLQVVEACSGLRYLFPLIVLSVLFVYFYKARLWKKIIIVLSSIPLTVISNSLRIAVTGILSKSFGPQAAEGFLHDFEGWLIFMGNVAFLGFEIWLLNRLFPEKEEEREGDFMDENAKSLNTPEKSDHKNTVRLKLPMVVMAVILSSHLALTFAVGREFHETLPIRKTFDQFPLQMGGWSGNRQYMEQNYIDRLKFTEYFMANYHDRVGKTVQLYTAYYATQRKGESIHSPATCLPGSGWSFNRTGTVTVQMDDQRKIALNHAIIQKNDMKQIAFYGFPSRGRYLTNEFQMKFYNFWDALRRHRSDGALVRVITDVCPGETMEQAEDRIRLFVQQVFPLLDDYLPK